MLSTSPVIHIPAFTGWSSMLREFPALKRRLPSSSLWTKTYSVAKVGSVGLDVVKRYIENIESQKEV